MAKGKEVQGIIQKEPVVGPQQGVEFSPRPIGSNWLACFVCGDIKNGYRDLDPKTHEPTGEIVPSVLAEDGIHYSGGYYSTQPDMASFVKGEENGKRVVKMFEEAGSRAWLDYRPSEPNWVQVKVGACSQHLPNLEHLQILARGSKNRISLNLIKLALTSHSETAPAPSETTKPQ